jgi:hypothetical protein
MSSEANRCPKCNGEMVQGFTVDRTYGGIFVSDWFEGAPKRSFWLPVNVRKKQRVPIGTFRCSNCGFLECYARSEFAAESCFVNRPRWTVLNDENRRKILWDTAAGSPGEQYRSDDCAPQRVAASSVSDDFWPRCPFSHDRDLSRHFVPLPPRWVSNRRD